MLGQIYLPEAELGQVERAVTHELPAVDVIVAFRNERHLLPGKLENLRRLDYPDELLRFLLVDGLSTDGSGELAERMARMDSRFVLLQAPVANKARQINLALKRSTAPWVLVTDADAQLPPGTLRSLVQAGEKDRRVAVAGVFHLPRGSAWLDRVHWKFWNLTRRWEHRSGSTSVVMGPCYLIRGSWLFSLPEDVVADDLYVSFAALAAGRRITLADLVVVERRSPAGTMAALVHKVRKGRAFLREVLRFLPRSLGMVSPMRELFLWRAASVLVAPLVILTLVSAGIVLAPVSVSLILAIALACCLAPVEERARWRWGRGAAAAAGLVGLWVILAVVLCVALISLPFVSPKVPYSRWRQEEA